MHGKSIITSGNPENMFSHYEAHMLSNIMNYLICIKDVKDIGSKLFGTSMRKELLVDSFKFLQ